MDKREAKRWACATVAAFIDEYMAAGQPWDDHECEHDCIECLRKVTGLKQLQREMDRRAKGFRGAIPGAGPRGEAVSARKLIEGVTVNPEVGYGRPCIAGTRIPTAVIANRLTGGESVREIAHDYDLGEMHIEAAIRWELLSPYRRKRILARSGKEGGE